MTVERDDTLQIEPGLYAAIAHGVLDPFVIDRNGRVVDLDAPSFDDNFVNVSVIARNLRLTPVQRIRRGARKTDDVLHRGLSGDLWPSPGFGP